ncbi:high affinity cGMP-specific 3',5'-cyclic phosphodiesterase 9A-like [Actinia tenebrosa]|uniref:Phosphodiesterase n=1 Tax=Actinia tenebrosa TaxID=6105 RepID=A0A6P8HJ30_ACTTE|nr:high affinity cGMP-specific 3',5'-cyclic phosphodiesterase 9A-like [Actinia tenebrosa]
MLASVAGVNRWANLTVKRQDGSYVVIEPNMPLNTPRNPYIVSVSSISSKYGDESVLKGVITRIADTIISHITAEQIKQSFEERANLIEGRIKAESNKLIELQQLHQEVTEIREQIGQDRITWKAIQDNKNKPKSHIKVARPAASYPKHEWDSQTLQFLKKPSFNIWHWEPNEMLSLLEHMYHDLDLVHEFKINVNILRRFLMCIQANYRNNPFHNFRHCFCVTQMMYGIIHLCNLKELLSSLDILVLLTTCVCHDLDHPGYNNTYQINAKTDLSVRYNDTSPLENHHAATAFDILSQPEYNIFGNLSQELFTKIRQEMIMLILATDMARHSEIVENFKSKLSSFDFRNEDYLNSMKMILVKCCDISNEVRPMEVSDPWVDCLLEEYFMQSDREKAEGLPVAPFMDRDKVTKATAQIGFIKFVLIPLFESLSKLFPQIDGVMVKPLREAYEHYENKRVEEENLRRARNERIRSSEGPNSVRTSSQGGTTDSPVCPATQPADKQEDRNKDNEDEKQDSEKSEKSIKKSVVEEEK